MTIFTRIRNAWAVLWGRTIALEHSFQTDAEAELLQLHKWVAFAIRYTKGIPMALADDITALGTAINNALAAKDAGLAPLQQQVTDLTAQVADLTNQIAAADAQVQALTAQIPH